MSLYQLGADTVAPASVASVEIADKANRVLASHDEKFIGLSITDDGEVRIVSADAENDPSLNDFYGAEVEKPEVRFAAIYGPAPTREELQVYKRAKQIGTISIYTKSPIVIGIGAAAAGLIVGLLLKGHK